MKQQENIGIGVLAGICIISVIVAFSEELPMAWYFLAGTAFGLYSIRGLFGFK